MTRKRDRAFAGFFAGLFLLTSSALTIGIIYQAVQDHKSNSPAASTKPAASTTNKEKPVDNKAKLAGTQLANFTPLASIPELQTSDTAPGTGAVVTENDSITVDYTGAVAATGVIFQSSKDSGQPVTFPLNQVIAGWTKGIPGMKEGGTRRLLIPANLAYGASPPPGSNIPPNADLVFDVTVHKISK